MSMGLQRLASLAGALAAAALLAACAGIPSAPPVEDRGAARAGAAGAAPAQAAPQAQAPRRGAYYKDDGPGDNSPDFAAIPEPVPRVEPLSRAANNPYNVFGVDYVPLRSLAPFTQRGTGSWYGRRFQGQRTSSGEPYDMYGMTAAHPTLPIPSYARVTNLANGRSVIVRVNDRGPFLSGRIMDLSYTAAWKLGYAEAGSTTLQVELLTPETITALSAHRPPAALARADTPPAPATAPAAAQPAAAQTVALGASPVAPLSTPLPAPAPANTMPASAALPVDATGGLLYLQLGAFSLRDNAESFRGRLQREFDWMSPVIDIVEKGGLFRLRLGPYRSRGDADSAAERIRAALDMKPVLVQ
jgi:rare lipoprotein A